MSDPAPTSFPNLRDEFPVPTLEQWWERARAELPGVDAEKRLRWCIIEGLTVEPIYTRAHQADLPHLGTLPGEAPHVRGAQPASAGGRGWLIAQECDLRSPEEVNGAVRDGLAKGQTAVRILFDEAVARGLDGDDHAARELVGVNGCTMTSFNGLRIALAEVDLEKHSISLEAGAAGGPVFAALIALAQEQHVSLGKLRGAVGGDPIAELLRVGSLPLTLPITFDELAARVAWAADNAPGVRTSLISGHVYHGAGASVVQELAATMAAATETLRALTERGIAPDTAAQAISFTLPVSANLYLEIAKLRAARMLWAKIVKAFGAVVDESFKMWTHVRTGAFSETVVDMHCNLVRTTVQAFIGAVGGCDSMSVTPFDHAAGRRSELAWRMARNQQILLQEEAHLARVADPLGGANVIEALTDAVARAAWAEIQRIESEGGLIKQIESGALQAAIAETAAKRQEMLRTRRDSIVGVTNYVNAADAPGAPAPAADDRAAFVEQRKQRVERLRAVRHNRHVAELVAGLMASRGKDLVGCMVNAAREGATIGEMMAALAANSDTSLPKVEPLAQTRAAAPFETLRAHAARHAEATGKAPEVFLVPMGPLAMRRARADFCANFLGAGGFEVFEPEAFDEVEAASDAVVEHGAKVAVLCSDDETYPKIASEFVKRVKAQVPETLVIVAGYPKDAADWLRDAGVDEFIHLRADQIAVLTSLQRHFGMEVE